MFIGREKELKLIKNSISSLEDILTSNESGITVYECKWTNSEFGSRELDTLKNDSSHLKPIKYGSFSLNGFSSDTKEKLDYCFYIDELF